MGKAYTMLTSIAMTLVADGGSSDGETEWVIGAELAQYSEQCQQQTVLKCILKEWKK
jgi:hypothetical protein